MHGSLVQMVGPSTAKLHICCTAEVRDGSRYHPAAIVIFNDLNKIFLIYIDNTYNDLLTLS